MDEREQLHQQQAGVQHDRPGVRGLPVRHPGRVLGRQGDLVPVWAWMNLLAHGTEAQIGRDRVRSGPTSGGPARSWRDRPLLPGLRGARPRSTPSSPWPTCRRPCSIPLELEMAARPEVSRLVAAAVGTTWWTTPSATRPRRWSADRGAPPLRTGRGGSTATQRSTVRGQGGQREDPGAQHEVVELPEVEAGAEALRGLACAGGRSRAGRPCRPGPGRGTRCSGRPRTSTSMRGSGVCAAIQSTACWRVQPMACRPVSTTSRLARHESAAKSPMRARSSL